MNKLKLFRIIGESQARVQEADIIGNDDVATCLFEELVKEMYPVNTRCRQWALSNMIMFYKQELERMEIIKRLSCTTPKKKPPSGPRINQTLRTGFKE